MPQAGDPIPSLWDDARAPDGEAGRLLYRSNLLGADTRVTNFGGGNTSAKVTEADPLTGEAVEVLWVKGSGGDLGTMGLDSFATLAMDRLRALKARFGGDDDAMVALQPHATFGLNPRAASIDTPLHAFVPHVHVDHVHPDAIIALAASADSERWVRECFGTEIGWLPWKRPGFGLGLMLERFCAEHPEANGVVLESHGLFTWAEDARACYELTLATINRAIAFLAGRATGPAFGGPVQAALPPEDRRRVAARLMPAIRGIVAGGSPEAPRHKAGHFDDRAEVLEFVGSRDLDRLAALGTSCPDHFLRTKIRPLVVPFDGDVDATLTALPALTEGYRADYAAYHARNRSEGSPALRDPDAVVWLVPGVGMMTFAADKATARVAGEFYVNTINVMRGSESLGGYRALPEREAFDIEYWAMEEAKLRRMPKPKPLTGRVALVTGGAGGIGAAIAARLLGDGACVVLADIDRSALDAATAALGEAHGADRVAGVHLDVTDEDAVARAFADACVAFGGLDIVVSNAGIASSAAVEDTSLALWTRSMDILSTGYFLVAREAFRLMKRQGTGGAIVFVASKNGLAASPGAAAYCTAKAAEIHLARCLALEGAPHGIRVNTVNPDAVLRGSRIWEGEWLAARSAQMGTDRAGLEEHYRQRSLLKRGVYPEDVAEAVAFLASDLASKSTGNILNVDAGNPQSFTR